LKIRELIKGGVVFTLFLCCFSLFLYAFGAARAYSDRTLLFLLQVNLYLGFLLCIFSICSMGFSFRVLLKKPRLRDILAFGLYLFLGIFGLSLVFLNSFIAVAAGGNA
jgi:hypothetical protein